MASVRYIDTIDPDSNHFNDLYSNSENFNQSEYLSVQQYNDISSCNDYYTLLNYNIRSFRQNSNSFLSLFDNNFFPNIIVISETWFSEFYQEDISGYTAFHAIRENQRSGGVSTFISNEFCSNIISSLTFCNNDIEICSVEAFLDSRSVIIIFVYRPHSGTIENFSRELENVFNSSAVRGFQCVITGDFNINLCSDSNEVHRFIENMNSYHFIPIITKPTRFPSCESSSPSLLDHIWINKITMYKCGIVLHDFTDHLPNFFNFLKPCKTKSIITILNPKFIFVTIVRVIGIVSVLHCNPLIGLPLNLQILIFILQILLINSMSYIAVYSL